MKIKKHLTNAQWVKINVNKNAYNETITMN